MILCILASAGCAEVPRERNAAWAALVDPHRQEMNVDGVTLHYIDLGPEPGEPLVMVHGFGDSTYAWHRNAAVLRDAGQRVILVDQPGLGRSAIPGENYVYSVENQAEAILGLLTRLGILRFRLIGHSMGGGIALYLGAHHPQRVSRVAVIDAASFRPACNFGIPGVELLARAVGPRLLASSALRSAYFNSGKIDQTLIDEVARPLYEDARRMHVLTALCRQYFSAAYERMTQSYARFVPPLLIVWGKEDRWIPSEYGERLHRLVPGSRLQLIGMAGHAPQQEAADAVNALLLDFFRADRRGRLIDDRTAARR